MASKRIRIFQSSSQGDIRIFNQMNRLESPVALWHQRHKQAPLVIDDMPPLVQQPATKKPSVIQPRRSIFQLASPPGSPVRERQCKEGSKDFLKACSLCKKDLPEKDIYMYGDLAAFCSIECRDHQMNLDGFHKKTVIDCNNGMLKGAIALAKVHVLYLARKKKIRDAILAQEEATQYSTTEEETTNVRSSKF